MEKKSIVKIITTAIKGVCTSFKNLGKNTLNVLTTIMGITSIEVNNEETMEETSECNNPVEQANTNIIQVGTNFMNDIKNVGKDLKDNIVDYFRNAQVDASINFNDINVKATNEGVTIGIAPVE